VEFFIVRNTFKVKAILWIAAIQRIAGTQSRALLSALCAIVTLALIAFSFTACGNGSTGGGPAGGGDEVDDRAVYESVKDGTTYRLEITRDIGRAAFVPADGDAYTLTITKAGSAPQTSTGTIAVLGATVTLTHSSGATITVTISAGVMTGINGVIPIDGGGSVAGPGAVTPREDLAPSGGFEYREVSAGVEITGYTGDAKGVSIPEMINLKPVVAIGANAFHGMQLTGVTIPNSVASIGDGAFSGNLLASITIPSGVNSIEDGAFASNPLTSVTFRGDVSNIASYAFDGDLVGKYKAGGAGTYTRPDIGSTVWTKQ
jgi:hypothetical protein